MSVRLPVSLRSFFVALFLAATIASGCKQGIGEVCQVDDDCESGNCFRIGETDIGQCRDDSDAPDASTVDAAPVDAAPAADAAEDVDASERDAATFDGSML